MRHDIELYYHPKKPVPVASVQTHVLEQDFSERCTERDNELIEWFWKTQVLPKNPQATSMPRGRANLIECMDSNLTFEYVEYKQYLATSKTAGEKERPLSAGVYDAMRIAAVGAALVLPDDAVLVHRRPYGATHVAGVFDCSTAGVLPVDANGAYIERGLHEKLKREIGLQPDEVHIEGITGVHSADAPDFSGLVTTLLRTPLERKEIEQRMKPDAFPEVRYIPRRELAGFVIEHYLARDMNHDGAMTLLSSLPYGEWAREIRRLQEERKDIKIGMLANADFMETYEDI